MAAGCGPPSGPAGAAPAGGGITPASQVRHVDVEGRSVRVYTPERPGGLLLALHGAGGDGDAFARSTGLDSEAARRHLVAAYPSGLGGAWNAGFCCPFGSPPAVDDTAFLAALIERLARPGWRVFVAGFSNGAMMAYRLACRIPARLAAIAVVGADSEECAPASPPPAILAIQGTADQLTGNRVWALRSGLWVNTEPSATARWTRLGASVRLVAVAGGGHTWYRSNPDATAEIGSFFANLPAR